MKLSFFTLPAFLLCTTFALSPVPLLAQNAAPTTKTDLDVPDRSGVRLSTRAAFEAIYAEVDAALLKKDAAAATKYWAPDFQQVDGDGNINPRETALNGLQKSAAQLPALNKVTSRLDTIRRIPTDDGSERYVIEVTTTIEADLKNAAGTIRKLKAIGQSREVWIVSPSENPEVPPLFQQILSVEMVSKTFLDGIEIPL